jgi:hypothetical protein
MGWADVIYIGATIVGTCVAGDGINSALRVMRDEYSGLVQQHNPTLEGLVDGIWSQKYEWGH